MALRKLIKQRGSLYVSIPAGICEVLGFHKGDDVRVDYVPDLGILVKKQFSGVSAIVPEVVEEEIKRVRGEALDEIRRAGKATANSLVNSVWLRTIGMAVEKDRLDEVRFSSEPSPSPPALLSDPFLQEEIMLLEARSQTAGQTAGQTRNQTRSQTGSNTVSRKKINGVQKAHRRKGGLVNGGRR